MKHGDMITVGEHEYRAMQSDGSCYGCAGFGVRLCVDLPPCFAGPGTGLTHPLIFVRKSAMSIFDNAAPDYNAAVERGAAVGIPLPVSPVVDQHAPGAKLDHGKTRPSLILNGMARALSAVAEVGTFGANKYTDGGWVHVPNGFQRYEDAQQRHALARATGESRDPESQLLHLAHEAWNALAKLDLHLRDAESRDV